MPLSKNRRKNGKKVIRGKAARQAARAREIELINNPPAALTLQDLINVVAYQESQKPDDDPTKMHNPNLEKEDEHTVVSDDVKIEMADNMVVNIIDEDGNKRPVGSAKPIPGDSEHVSIHIDNEEILRKIQGPLPAVSIAEEETQDGR